MNMQKECITDKCFEGYKTFNAQRPSMQAWQRLESCDILLGFQEERVLRRVKEGPAQMKRSYALLLP